MANPQAIYDALKACVDAVADFVPTSQDDLALAQIKSRTIHLAVPELTSPVHWRYLRAGRYASSRNLSMIVTRIRE
jgi:hypothetical protein